MFKRERPMPTLNIRVNIRRVILIAAFLSAHQFACADDDIDFGPLFMKDRDLHGNVRARALGPLLESRKSASGDELLAFHPLYSYLYDSKENLFRRQMLYPVWLDKGRDEERERTFLLLFQYHDFDVYDPYSKYRLWLFPIYFQGRNTEGIRYIGIFPIVGNIREFFGFDEFRFAMFPFLGFIRSGDVKTKIFLWPIVTRTTGGGNDRLNVFPLYGHSKLREESDKYYVMWPFWTYARYSRPLSPGYGYVAFPFYGRVNLENQQSDMFLPPLFRFGHGDKLNRAYSPWPFVQFSSGEVTKYYFWPLWGRKNIDTSRYAFLLWPLGIRYDHSSPFYQHSRSMFFPFYYASKTVGSFDKPDRKMDQPQRTLKIWPLFSWLKDTNEGRFSMLSLFPYRDYDAIDRNYSPLWTIYSHTWVGDEAEDELLWGLIRYRRSESKSKFSLFPLISVGHEKGNGCSWSLLKGLIGREKTGKKTRIRLLYFITF